MQNLELQLTQLSKLKIYTVAKKLILDKMDRNIITPQKASELIDYFKKGLPPIITAQAAEKFYMNAAETFPELRELPSYFENQKDEKLDELIMNLTEVMMKNENLGNAYAIIKKLETAQNKNEKMRILGDLEQKYPHEFNACIVMMIQQ